MRLCLYFFVGNIFRIMIVTMILVVGACVRKTKVRALLVCVKCKLGEVQWGKLGAGVKRFEW